MRVLSALLITSLIKISVSLHDVCTGLDRSNCPLSASVQPDYTNGEKLEILRRQGVYYFLSLASKETTFTLNSHDSLLVARPLSTDHWVTSRGDFMKYHWVPDENGFRYTRKEGVDTATIHVLIGDRSEWNEWQRKYYPQSLENHEEAGNSTSEESENLTATHDWSKPFSKRGSETLVFVFQSDTDQIDLEVSDDQGRILNVPVPMKYAELTFDHSSPESIFTVDDQPPYIDLHDGQMDIGGPVKSVQIRTREEEGVSHMKVKRVH